MAACVSCHGTMVPRSHAYSLAHAITARYWHDLGEDDVHWTISDTGWAKFAWGMIFGQWQLGATLLLNNPAPGFDTEGHLNLLAKHKVTSFCAPPTGYRAFAQLDLSQFDLSSVRHSTSAGEPEMPIRPPQVVQPISGPRPAWRK